MEQQEQFPTEILSGDVCDESKCVSRGLSNLHNDSLTCYGDDGTFYPMMCAEGFLPRVVDNEPAYVEEGVDGNEDVQLWYFTCCPPNIISSEAIVDSTRHCSDPITSSIVPDVDGNENLHDVCGNQATRKYPRPMKSNLETSFISVHKTDSFICCDNDSVNPLNFLDDSECLPYRNQFYESFKIQNQVGWLRAISCDFPEGEFSVPRPFDGANNDLVSLGRYQCCKSGTGLPPFVQDSVFKTTTYLMVTIWSIAAFVSVLVATGLLIPLWIKPKHGVRAWGRSRTRGGFSSSNFMSSRSRTITGSSSIHCNSSALRNPTSNFGPSTRREGGFQTAASQRKRENLTYSTYNLYLVFLATFDLFYALTQIGWYGSYIDQRFNPRFYAHLVSASGIFYSSISKEITVAVPYMVANLMINAIISHQVLVLLRNSNRRIKTNPPSLRRVKLHGGAVFVISVIYGSIFYILQDASRRKIENDELENIQTIYVIPLIMIAIMSLPPLGYVVYVTAIVIWKRGYMPSATGVTHASAAMRELAIYFCRIVAVFFAVWIPVVILTLYASGWEQYWASVLAQCLAAIQPIFTTCMVLTKSDVRKYIWDLVTLSYLLGDCHSQKGHKVGEIRPTHAGKASREASVSAPCVDAVTEAHGDTVGDDAATDESHSEV